MSFISDFLKNSKKTLKSIRSNPTVAQWGSSLLAANPFTAGLAPALAPTPAPVSVTASPTRVSRKAPVNRTGAAVPVGPGPSGGIGGAGVVSKPVGGLLQDKKVLLIGGAVAAGIVVLLVLMK